MTKSDERWLTDGDCQKCRRNKYCKKTCTAFKRRTKRDMTRFIEHRTGLGRIFNMLGGRMF